ncbi:MAG: acyl carrier protein [Acidimicrobiales bacterium]
MPGETGSRHDRFGRQQALDLVRASLAEILEVSPDSIAEGASFRDLGADSLALIELVEALEKDLGAELAGFRIDDEDLEDLKTVRDAVDYVVAKLASAG